MKREEYLKSIKDEDEDNLVYEDEDNLVYIDESGMEIADCRTRGWGQKGKPLFGKKSGKHYQRINIIAAYVNRKIIAQFQFTGKCNAEKFNLWVENYLIKALKRGQKVIMDNASFHKSLKTKKTNRICWMQTPISTAIFSRF